MLISDPEKVRVLCRPLLLWAEVPPRRDGDEVVYDPWTEVLGIGLDCLHIWGEFVLGSHLWNGRRWGEDEGWLLPTVRPLLERGEPTYRRPQSGLRFRARWGSAMIKDKSFGTYSVSAAIPVFVK